MAAIKRFEEIIAWQKARGLVQAVYLASENWNDYGLKDQLRRASVSIMSNIAEGFERRTNSDFRHFLYIAKASCGETRSLLVVVSDLRLLSEDNSKKLTKEVVEISKLLSGLIKTL